MFLAKIKAKKIRIQKWEAKYCNFEYADSLATQAFAST